MEKFLDRFLGYVKKNTRSDDTKAGVVIPSTASQMEFLKDLSEELKEIGLVDVKINEKNAFLTATLPANVEDAPVIGLLHMWIPPTLMRIIFRHRFMKIMTARTLYLGRADLYSHQRSS